MEWIFLVIVALVVITTMYLRRHPEIIMKWLLRRIMPRPQQGESGQRRQTRRSYGGKSRRAENSDARRPANSRASLKSYAQDVEFVEESDTDAHQRSTHRESVSFRVEEQVSDAEWEEIP
jgi:hypothetical protein